MRYVGDRRGHTSEGIVRTRCLQGKHVAQVWSGLVASGERRNVPTHFDRFWHGGVVDGAPCYTEHGSCCNAGRDQNRGNAQPEPREVKTKLADGVVRRNGAGGRRDMVKISAVLVIGDEQQRIVPAWAITESIVYVVDQL